MKFFKFLLATLVVASVSFGAMASSPKIKKDKNLEGNKVNAVDEYQSDWDMAEELSDDGKSLVKMPYRWFAGYGKATDKQIAIELAQRDAMNSIARFVATTVKTEAEQKNMGNNGVIMNALRTQWSQKSQTMLKGCIPFGPAHIEYDEKTSMYTVTAKVAIRGDKYREMLGDVTAAPANMPPADVQQFIDINEAIFNTLFGDVPEE